MNPESSRPSDSSSRASSASFWAHAPVVLGIGLSVLFLALAARRVRLAEVGAALSGVRPAWLPIMACTVFGDILVRSLRWRFLLGPAAPSAKLRELYQLETIGLALNNVFFMRIGEAVRGCLAAQSLAVPLLTVFATIFVERLLDLMSLLLLFGITARLYPALVEPRLSILALAAAIGAALALVILARLDGVIQGPLWAARFARAPRLHRWMCQLSVGARALRRASTAAAAVLLGFSLWTLDAGFYWIAGRAMGLNPELTFGHSVFLLAGGAAASFLPAVPGSFGTFEQAVKLLLMNLGIGESVALGFAAFVHVTSYLMVTGLGILFLYQAGHTLASLKALGKRDLSASL